MDTDTLTRSYIGTFGQGDARRRNSFVRLDATDKADATRIMNERYGRNWSFVYLDTPEDPAGIVEYDLTQIELGT